MTQATDPTPPVDPTPPAGADPTPPAEPEGGKGPKGKPDEDAKAKRLEGELAASKQREADLQAKLDAAKTVEDVQKAVEEAKADAERQVKEIAVNALLVTNGCLNAVALIAAAGLDVTKAEVASDGSVISGVDIEELKKAYPYLFASEDNQPNIQTAAAAGGPAKTMTREEIMSMTDPVERRKAIAANPDVLLN